jgi:hypothetical protein
MVFSRRTTTGTPQVAFLSIPPLGLPTGTPCPEGANGRPRKGLNRPCRPGWPCSFLAVVLQIPFALAWIVYAPETDPGTGTGTGRTPGRPRRRLLRPGIRRHGPRPGLFFRAGHLFGARRRPTPGPFPGRAPADVTARRQPRCGLGSGSATGLARAPEAMDRDAGKPG